MDVERSNLWPNLRQLSLNLSGGTEEYHEIHQDNRFRNRNTNPEPVDYERILRLGHDFSFGEGRRGKNTPSSYCGYSGDGKGFVNKCAFK